MGSVREVNIKITGQVSEFYGKNDYEVMVARLRFVCAEYGLELEEDYKFEKGE